MGIREELQSRAAILIDAIKLNVKSDDSYEMDLWTSACLSVFTQLLESVGGSGRREFIKNYIGVLRALSDEFEKAIAD